MKKLPISLFIGRFQPFHNGHLFALRWIAKKSQKTILAIGSAQEKMTFHNPFSAKERERMIKKLLKAEGLEKKVLVFLLDDINDDKKWVAHVDKHLPKYDVVYSNNRLVRRLMKEAGKKVLSIPFYKKKECNATNIRAKMAANREWESLVPREIAKELRRLKAQERIRNLSRVIQRKPN
ncbi:MAG: nicotinamide-nucleotide adenylyltransferase [Candidatus Micrarchaeota archaeon]|nr:nicotinamide-nucleotide adenylyltransferase [Candidatus Micrarchaeota archaeon]